MHAGCSLLCALLLRHLDIQYTKCTDIISVVIAHTIKSRCIGIWPLYDGCRLLTPSRYTIYKVYTRKLRGDRT